jgi:cysteinyl-tRNA synthetase
MIQIHDSLTGELKPLKPIKDNHVRMYVCGMTVYDYCHIGHARSLVVFDMIRRYIKHRGFELTHVRNITDIDDKIIQRANERGIPFEQLTEQFITAMNEDAAQLNVQRPEHEPRATEYIPQMLTMIETLVGRGAAYASGGDVYFKVANYSNYGQLSGKRLADLKRGARVEVGEKKHDPLDFVLWKASKPNEPAWDSPWGKGRPGWHIECSAMSMELLGEYFDLHGGGMDLKFPHHENERAQSGACCDTPFVNIWMHNGFVNVDAEKMSKSLDNFFTIREVQKHLRPEVLRAFVLQSHYRGPVNFTTEALDQADALLERFYTTLRDVPLTVASLSERHVSSFKAAMDQDFNTPEALAEMMKLAREINALRASELANPAELSSLVYTLKTFGEVLGLLTHDPIAWLQTPRSKFETDHAAAQPQRLTADEIEAHIAARKLARSEKRFKDADAIRAQLESAGVVLEDGPNGTVWRYG